MAPKAKPKTAGSAAPPVAIEDLFTSINRHIEKDEYENAVKVSDQVLSIAPGDEDAIRCKVVALIKNESIEKALSTIESCSKKSLVDFSFFKGYCLYRQNKLDEALETVKGKEDKSSMLLKSQILYRLRKMDECVDVYQKLQRSEIFSLETNFVAGLVSAGRSSEVEGILKSLRVKATDTFELAYNTACSLVERNKYKDAEQMLLSARTVGQEALVDEDNLADDEIESELAPISVQLAYVQQILGNTQEAFESYSNIIKKNLADDLSLAVAISNLISLKGPKDVPDGLRKLDKLIEKGAGPQTFQLVRGLDSRLSQKQRESIYVNRLLLLLHSNKLDQARELVSALPGMFPESIMPVLLQAAVHVRENKANKAEEILANFASKSPKNSKIIWLARAQIAAAAGHPQVSAESLLKIPDIQHKPATVATIVSLKERAGDIDGADVVFNSAIQWWSNAMAEDNKLNIIMQEAASFKLKHGKKEEAARLYEELVKSLGSIDALVGLIQTAAHTDVQKAESYEMKLKPLPGLKGIDVDSLEKTSGAKQTENGVSDIGEAYEVKNKEKAKKKRKRKPKYPKGFDPGNPGPPPDPERWLPRRERSSFKPKRKDKRAAQVRGSQGAVAKEAATTMSSKSDQTSTSKGIDQSSNAQSKRGGKNSRKKSRN